MAVNMVAIGAVPMALVETASSWPLGPLAAAFVAGAVLLWLHQRFLGQPEALKSAQRENERLEAEVASVHARNTLLEGTQVSHGRTIDAQVGKIEDRDARISLYEDLRRQLLEDEGTLWRMHPTPALEDQLAQLEDTRTKVVTVGNLKGGVGKTMLTSNLAGYFDQRLGLRVLCIDLDYQGSLTDIMMGLSGEMHPGSQVDALIEGDLSGANLVAQARPVGSVLPRTHYIGAGYDLTQTENRALLRWLLAADDGDFRYNLRTALTSPAVQEAFDVVLIDTAPRIGPASINALCASHYLVIPTLLDQVSALAVPRFLSFLSGMQSDLNPALRTAGIIVNMTHERDLTPREEDVLADLRATNLGGFLIEQRIQRLRGLSHATGEKLYYSSDRLFREGIFNRVGDELARRMGFAVPD